MTDREVFDDGIADGFRSAYGDEDSYEYGDDFGEDYGDEYVKLPRRSGIARRIITVFLVLILLGGAGGFGVVAYVGGKLDPPGEPGAAVEIEVPAGYTVSDVGGLLAEAGVISDSTVFRYYAKRKKFDSVKAGQYELPTNSAMWDVINLLDKGPLPPPFEQVMIPEGLRKEEIVERLLDQMPELDSVELVSAIGGLESTLRPEGVTSVEGLLYPATYRVEEGDEADEAKLIAQMTGQLEATTSELGYDRAVELTGRTPYELLVIASLIEEEARVPEDQAKISRVIHNRLDQGMKLEIDATVIYALGSHKETLTQSDLETDSPYNTRLYPGLPPTPIAAPGRGALEAALFPAEGDWLFYVLADDQGGHFFTSDYNEFLRVKRESQEAGIF